MPKHEREVFRQQEENLNAQTQRQLEDLYNNCHIRPHFAKTYAFGEETSETRSNKQ